MSHFDSVCFAAPLPVTTKSVTGAHQWLSFRSINAQLALTITVIAAIGGWPSQAFCENAAAHEDEVLVLSDLTVLREFDIEGFDENGLHTTSAGTLTWDQIYRLPTTSTRLSSEQLVSMQRLHQALGPALRDLSVRMQTGDTRGALRAAEQVEFAYRRSHGLSAYQVHLALFHGRLVSGKREAATASMLWAMYLEQTNPELSAKIPASFRVPEDLITSIAISPPVWFEAGAALLAAEVLKDMLTEMPTRDSQLGIAVIAYTASLTIAAADAAATEHLLGQMSYHLSQSDDLASDERLMLDSLHELLEARFKLMRSVDNASEFSQATEALRARAREFPIPIKMLATFELATIALRSDSQVEMQRGALELLRIAADTDARSADLAAAGIYAILQSDLLQDNPLARQSLTQELIQDLGHTWHGRKARQAVELHNNGRN